ncbi:MAG: hypothetical protein RLP44_14525 [Aggregatilineales bacterium]
MAITTHNRDTLFSKPTILDDNLPSWARRSNPIIRRQLGVFWRVFTPELDTIARLLTIQVAVILSTIYFPALLTPILMLTLASFMLLPVAFYMYAQLIINVINDSVTVITKEFSNDTLTLLRVTPISLREIVLSKVAASFWRRMEPLDNVLSMALYLGTPLLVLVQILSFPPDEYPVTSQLMIVATLIVSIVRLPLEMFMVAMLGTVIGTATRVRTPAIIATGVIVFFYFLLINLPRLLELSLPLQILVDIILPIAVPLVLIWLSLRGTLYLLQRE